jgi:hypothetical protein
MYQSPKTSARERRSSEIDHHVMAGGKCLACRPLCDNAESHSSVLRAKHIPATTAQEVGWFLAKSGDANVAAPKSNSDLAA